jgi:hypothetical protein
MNDPKIGIEETCDEEALEAEERDAYNSDVDGGYSGTFAEWRTLKARRAFATASTLPPPNDETL